jgi:hypothetical protein
MSRPRTPKALASVTGADLQHPARYAGRTEPSVPPLGSAPECLTEAQREAWARLADEMPWLGRSDRQITALAARLMVIAEGFDAPISAFGELRLCLQKMGGTPADRSRIPSGSDDEDDSAERFFQ